jgi:preprotein translocase subunit YajC
MTLRSFPHPLPLALSAPPEGAPSLWVQLIPFFLILGIFYFIILLPMRRRQKKVSEFQAALKSGDRVVTTSGIYGSITKINETTVQLQVAANVRIEVAKAAIAGYQGQAPVVQDSSNV